MATPEVRAEFDRDVTGNPAPRGPFGALRIVLARLRFLFVFAAVFAVIGSAETIRTYWARLTTGPTPEAAISSDTEFFCPMDPGVLSDWPSKCPVCNMTLVRRKRGEPTPLPDGVMARMQFTPYRLWLGGIKTTVVDYAPLARTVEVPGTVVERGDSPTWIEAHVFARELAWIDVGQAVDIVPAAEGGHASATGKVREVPRGGIASGSTGKIGVGVETRGHALRPGDPVLVRIHCAVDRLEPFRSQPLTPPLSQGEPREVFTCMEHPDVVRTAAGHCPNDGLVLMPHRLLNDQRVRWWCPMHPGVTADQPGSTCDACGGMILVPRVVSFRPPGRVLGVPGSSVIDDGARALVYVERGAGMFDGKVVVLGPRCGELFPVVSGLEPGDRVAAQGAFLIDAETRLNPSLAASYFGAAASTSVRDSAETSPPPLAKVETENGWLSGLTPADRSLALRQKRCPVTGKALGSMGVPPKIKVQGRVVFLCCDGCTSTIEADPKTYLTRIPLPSEDLGNSP